MSKSKKSWLLAAAVMAASFYIAEIPAIASGTSGKTALSLGVSQMAPETVSFEVPLFLTMCVAGSGGVNEVIVPSGYSIKNTKKDIPMAVTGLRVAGLGSSDWSVVETVAPGRTQKEIAMSIGGVSLPALTAGSTVVQEVNLTGPGSAFYDSSSGRYKRIGEEDSEGITMPLEITAQVSGGYTPIDQARPIAQFKLLYTVSCIDGLGVILDKDYEGPGRDRVTGSIP